MAMPPISHEAAAVLRSADDDLRTLNRQAGAVISKLALAREAAGNGHVDLACANIRLGIQSNNAARRALRLGQHRGSA